jgi:hypothetical protein
MFLYFWHMRSLLASTFTFATLVHYRSRKVYGTVPEALIFQGRGWRWRRAGVRGRLNPQPFSALQEPGVDVIKRHGRRGQIG